jgi:type II secretory pathway component GspD/PulD (secretin)
MKTIIGVASEKNKREIISISITIFIGTVLFILSFFPCCFSQEEKTDSLPLITNVFFETDIRQALQDIAAQAGIPILADDTVQGYVTAEFKDSPLEQALSMLLTPGGFIYQKMDGFYVVGSPDPASLIFSLLSDTELVHLNYIKPSDVTNLLPEPDLRYVKVNEPTDSLTISAPPEIMQRIKKHLSTIDHAPRQIMMEALVTELSVTAKKELGINWFWEWDSATTEDTKGRGSIDLEHLVGELTYATTGGFTRAVSATIEAMVEEGKATVRANPRVATLEGREATMFIGQEKYYSIVTGPEAYPYRTLESIAAGITLNLIPYVAENGDITVHIAPEVSDVTGEGLEGLPVITKRRAETTVRVKDGETIVIGGLVQERETKTLRRVPLLGSIPLLGILFRYYRPTKTKTEVVIFITPHLQPQAER